MHEDRDDKRKQEKSDERFTHQIARRLEKEDKNRKLRKHTEPETRRRDGSPRGGERERARLVGASFCIK